MGNTFGAHIFKRKSVGEREEVTIKLFKPDGSPLDVGETPDAPDLSTALLAAWKGDFDTSLHYPAGSLVRKSGHTYLALLDAPNTALEPGEEVALASATIPRATTGYALPRDVVATLAGLTGSSGFNLSGTPRWFKISGAPGEQLTVSYVGSSPNGLHFYDAGGGNLISGSSFASPVTITVPAEGYCFFEISETVTSVKYVGPNGPQPLPGNPWTLIG